MKFQILSSENSWLNSNKKFLIKKMADIHLGNKSTLNSLINNTRSKLLTVF